MSSLLKSDILKILSKEISGGGDSSSAGSKTRVAYESSYTPKTNFGLGGAKDDIKKAAPLYMTSEGCVKSTKEAEKVIDFFENEKSFTKSKHFKNRKQLDKAILVVRENVTNPECDGEQLAKMGSADLKYSIKYGDDAPKIKPKKPKAVKSDPPKPKPKLKINPPSTPPKPKPKLKINPASAPVKRKPKLKINPASTPVKRKPKLKINPPSAPVKRKPKLKINPVGTTPVKPKSKWHLFLAKFRKDHPELKGKDVMKQASLEYKTSTICPTYCGPPKPFHIMPDGAIHSGLTHTADSVVLKPAPKKRPKSKWMIFLDKFRKDHPEISGKDVMKQASIEYKKSTESDDGRKSREPTPYLPDDKPSGAISQKSANGILADLMDSFDEFGRTFERVANSDMNRKFKQSEFQKIMGRADDFFQYAMNKHKNDFDPISLQRIKDAYIHTQEEYTIGYKNLQSGVDQIEFSDYEDDEFVRNIIDKELEVDEHILDSYSKIRDEAKRNEKPEPRLTESVNFTAPNDLLPIELQIDVKAPDVRDADPKPPIKQTVFEDAYISREPSAIDDALYKEFADASTQTYGDPSLQYARRASLYPYNALADEKSIKPTTIANTNMITPRMKQRPKLKIKAAKKEAPLRERIYQKFHELMRKNGETDSAQIDLIWSANKDAYIDMLMDVVSRGGGDIHDKEHYYNAFSNIGELMCRGSGMCGGQKVMSGTGNTQYRRRHQTPAFDRAVYDTKNNPYGIGRTHADIIPPRLPKPVPPTPQTPSNDKDEIDFEDLSDPRAWTETFKNIAKGTYDGVKTIYKLFSPATWLP